nr:twin-arginine translocation signal domain-containing protein [Candidatus Levybacteria bacterium]
MGKETPLSIDSNLPSPNLFDARISRRDFLKLSGLSLAALGVGAELQIHAIGVLAEQIRDRETASLDNDSFIDVNRDKLSKVRLGCSFAPEQFGLSLATIDEDKTNGKLDNALDALRFGVEHLNIKQVRLGIRWNNSVDQNGDLDFKLYEPFLDYCMKNKVDICLNTGIKVFRWPEDHVPDGLIAENALVKHSNVYSQSDLARKSLDHTQDLFDFLIQRYGDEVITRITTLQPENEPFDGFGKHGFKMDPEYLKEFINLCLSYFPNSNILINSSDPSIFDQASRIFSSVERDNPQTRGTLISGYDYYPNHPKYPIIPIVGMVDAISLSKIFLGDQYAKNISGAKKRGFKIEITEGQAEPWGNIQLPGNSATAFKFMILRSINNVLDTTENSVIGIWGLEYLYQIAVSGNTTIEHERIFDLIQKINGGNVISLKDW